MAVVAAEGLVGRQAGLPKGICSAYLRTRQALQTTLAEYVAGGLAAILATSLDLLVGGLAGHELT